MHDFLNDAELITWMEKRFGALSKTVKERPDLESMTKIKMELLDILQKYKHELGIKNPIPSIKTWAEHDKIKFLFFDKNSGKRILLGEWLENKLLPYEQ